MKNYIGFDFAMCRLQCIQLFLYTFRFKYIIYGSFALENEISVVDPRDLYRKPKCPLQANKSIVYRKQRYHTTKLDV